MMNNLYPKLSVILLTGVSLASAGISMAFDYENLFAQNAQHCAQSLDSEKQNILERLFFDKVSERCVQYASKTTRDQLDQFFLNKQLTDDEYRQVVRWLTDKGIKGQTVKGTYPPNESLAVQSAAIIMAKEKSVEPLPTVTGFKSIGAQSKDK